jgi:electron transport complex protein RnfG
MDERHETAAPAPQVSRAGLLLGVFALGCSVLLALAHAHTRDLIAQRALEDLQFTIAQTIPPALHDNDLLADTIELARGDGAAPLTAYRARRDGAVTAVAYRWVTEAGYGGPITLVVGIARDGRVLGVRTVSHSETPGLGDKIDIRKSDWMRSFDGRHLDDANTHEWAVRKDGGQFDQFAGATITPRAVVAAVRESLAFFAENAAALLAADTDGHAEAGGRHNAASGAGDATANPTGAADTGAQGLDDGAAHRNAAGAQPPIAHDKEADRDGE